MAVVDSLYKLNENLKHYFLQKEQTKIRKRTSKHVHNIGIYKKLSHRMQN